MQTLFPTFEKEPAEHLVQKEAPALDWKLPAGQLAHTDRPVPSAYLPAGQLVQDWEPSWPVYVPRLQEVHTVAPEALKVPTGHSLKLLCPAKSWYEPAGTLEQTLFIRTD